MNKSNYFSHNYNARNDEKIIGVRMDYGCEGYGIYFMLLERLAESDDYTCATEWKRLAFDFQCSADKVQHIVEDYGLFEMTEDGSRFFSRSFMERMQAKQEKSERRAAAGRLGGQRRQQHLHEQAMPQQCSSNATENGSNATNNPSIANENRSQERKEKKENKKENNNFVIVKEKEENVLFETEVIEPKIPTKETKKKKKPRPDDLEEAKAYAKKLGCSETMAESFYDYFESNGWRVGGRTPMKDWEAAFRNWKRNEQNMVRPIAAQRAQQLSPRGETPAEEVRRLAAETAAEQRQRDEEQYVSPEQQQETWRMMEEWRKAHLVK